MDDFPEKGQALERFSTGKGNLTGEGKPIPPFLRRELQRMLRRYEFLIALIREVESDTAKAVSDPESPFPQKPKAALLANLGRAQSLALTTLTIVLSVKGW